MTHTRSFFGFDHGHVCMGRDWNWGGIHGLRVGGILTVNERRLRPGSHNDAVLGHRCAYSLYSTSQRRVS